MMMKSLALTAALLSLAVLISCSSAHNPTAPINVSVSAQKGITVLYVGQQNVQVTAKVSGTGNTAVTWSLNQNGTDCTNNPTLCGTLSSTAANPVMYTAPSTPQTVTIVATSQADTTSSGSLDFSIDNITVQISPAASKNVAVNVQTKLEQDFEAVAVPDDAPQTFNWSVGCSSGPCGTLVQDPNNPALAHYTAPASANSVSISATSTVDPTFPGLTTATVVSSRLPAGTYAFLYTGFNVAGAIAVAGQFVSNGNGTIQGNTREDQLSPSHTQCTISSSSDYSLSSNNQGTLTLDANCAGSTSNTYTTVLNANGDIQMIEDTPGDSTNRHGSGFIEPVPTPSKLNTAALSGSFAFGFTGSDLSGNRVGVVGVVTLDGSGNITGGTLDSNDNGTASGPQTISPGSYTMTNGVGSMTISAGTQSYPLELYGVSGGQSSGSPLTIYAISTNANPGLAGTMVFQDPTPGPNKTYDLKAFNGNSIVNLTGVGTQNPGSNVALSTANFDGSGHVSGVFDQNNAGALTPSTIDTLNPGLPFGTGYQYSNTGCTGCGRYTVSLLGNPKANPPAPMPFIMYAISANRGFLLDQTSASVMTGSMDLQGPKKHTFSASELASTFAAATQSSGVSSVEPSVANLLLSWVNPTQGVTGTEITRSGATPLTGTYTDNSSGFGSFTLTSPAATYVFYQLDVTHFWLMDMDSSNHNSSIALVQQ